MKKVTTIIEEKRVRIISPKWTASGQGYCFDIDEYIYNDEAWTNDERPKELLEKAKQFYKEKDFAKHWTSEPKIEIYWKKLSVQENIIE